MPLNDARELKVGAVAVPSVAISFDGGAPMEDSRLVPVEVPANLVYAGIPFAVMMTTPSDLEDFAYGFSLTEGIIEGAEDIRSVAIAGEERGLRIDIELTGDRLHHHLARKRAMAGRTGCGLCGIDDLNALPRAAAPAHPAPRLAVPAIRRALAMLEAGQSLNMATRAVHAAAWADLEGNIVAVREDVGRHNALDKLIGALLRAGAAPDRGFAIVTSRCSFELVEKVAAFGARSLVAISAPTSLALERARLHDMTLIGIARKDSMTLFNGFDRVRQQGALA